MYVTKYCFLKCIALKVKKVTQLQSGCVRETDKEKKKKSKSEASVPSILQKPDSWSHIKEKKNILNIHLITDTICQVTTAMVEKYSLNRIVHYFGIIWYNVVTTYAIIPFYDAF